MVNNIFQAESNRISGGALQFAARKIQGRVARREEIPIFDAILSARCCSRTEVPLQGGEDVMTFTLMMPHTMLPS
jgi:hypothetical protein